jgi:hypothetical protein
VFEVKGRGSPIKRRKIMIGSREQGAEGGEAVWESAPQRVHRYILGRRAHRTDDFSLIFCGPMAGTREGRAREGWAACLV